MRTILHCILIFIYVLVGKLFLAVIDYSALSYTLFYVLLISLIISGSPKLVLLLCRNLSIERKQIALDHLYSALLKVSFTIFLYFIVDWLLQAYLMKAMQ